MRCTCSMMPTNVKIIRIGDSEVGIIDLEETFREVYSLKIEDKAGLRKKLLEKIKMSNHIPADRENFYAEALVREYSSYIETRYRAKKVSPEAPRQSAPTFLGFLRKLAKRKTGK